MTKYILKRIGLALIVLFGVSVIIYITVRMMPNDFVDVYFREKLLSGDVKPEQIYEFKKLYGLHDNSFGGILSGYFSWLGNLLRGNLGESFKYRLPVAEVIGDNMWISFAVAFIALIFEFAIAIPLGVISATHQYSKRDYAVTVIALIGISLPSFFFSTLLIRLLASDSGLGLFPVSGMKNPNAQYPFLDLVHHLILPILVLVILSVGGLMRYTRTNMLEVLHSDYIRTARAKGLGEKKVIYKHAFRNTLIPLVTLMAGILPGLFGGAMIIEQVFSIDGIGKLAYDALMVGDVPFVMGYMMFLAILVVLGMLLSDLMYMLVDPRVKITK